MSVLNEIHKTKHTSVGLPVGIRRRAAVRPSLMARTGRAVDRSVTRVQEWLETDDTAGQKIVVYAVFSLAAAYVLGAVIIWLV